MDILFMLIGIILLVLILTVVIRALLLKPTKAKNLKFELDGSERAVEYGSKLSKLIQKETISNRFDSDRTKFLEFHELLEDMFPNVHSSTKEAYALVDEQMANGIEVYNPLYDEFESIYHGSVNEWKFGNSFTPALVKRYSEIDRALNCIRNSGAVYCEMSGSGSTVFGLFTSKEDVKKAENIINDQGFKYAIV